MYLNPASTTIGDLCQQMLRECGAFGLGQRPSSDDVNEAWARTQWMLQQWERKRWLVPHLVNLAKVSTGATSYSVGPGGDFDTGANSVRPERVESAFVRQLQSSILTEIDYTLGILQSREDYDKITLKTLQAGPGEAVWLDTAWPLGQVYVWPVPQASIYEIHISVRDQLPNQWTTLATNVTLPYEYYAAILYNGALRLRSRYQLSTFAGDPLPGMARDALATVRGPNTQIAKLRMPSTIRRRGLYNIFSDRPY